MSRSPSASPSKSELEDYLAGWGATLDLVKQGHSWSGNERNCSYLNCAGGPFANVSSATGLDFGDDGRGLALTDWDQDGDLDLWLRNRTGPRLRLMINGSQRDEQAPDSVAIRLRGVDVNHDAIGARVELHLADAAQPPMRQTLYAGDAFLSQSSKWLHFGLGRGQEIGRVVVHWPGGASEDFEGLAAGGRYLLVEGQGSAEGAASPATTSVLAPNEHAAWQPTDVAAVFLPARIPLPLFRYTTLEGEPRNLAPSGRPTLVTFWATWCSPCIRELDRFAAEESAMDRAGLDILALSVDGLDAAMGTSPDDARRHVADRDFPFATGMGSQELIEKLELAQKFYFDRVPAFALPTSFLVDADGQLAAVYRGEVPTDVLLEHVANLDINPGEYWDLAAPFPGRWLTRLGGARLNSVADLFRARFPEDAARYSKLALADLSARAAGGDGIQDRLALAEGQNSLGLDLAAQGKLDEAIAAYRQALDLAPDHFDAHSNLGIALSSKNAMPEAVQHLRRAVEISPDRPKAHFNLATALRKMRDDLGAKTHFERALSLDPEYGRAHYALATMMLQAGATGPALQHLRDAVRLEPDWAQPMDNLAWILATNKDDALRNGVEAVRLAERAAELTNETDPTVLTTLAAAYAESGRFDRAVPTAEKALQLVNAAGNSQAARAFTQFLEQYKRGQPVRY